MLFIIITPNFFLIVLGGGGGGGGSPIFPNFPQQQTTTHVCVLHPRQNPEMKIYIYRKDKALLFLCVVHDGCGRIYIHVLCVCRHMSSGFCKTIFFYLLLLLLLPRLLLVVPPPLPIVVDCDDDGAAGIPPPPKRLVVV